MANSQGIALLGATGTIGVNTLDVLSRHPSRFHVVALTANNNDQKLYQQCLDFSPRYAVLVDESSAQRLSEQLKQAGSTTEVLSGVDALEHVVALDEVDQVMAAIVGAAGLLPTLAAARAGKRVLLANKEALVMSGQLFMDTVHEHNAELLPIDSEHNAIFQCLSGQDREGVSRILLTGSGGPFLQRDLTTFADITPEQAVAHPNWVMGKKISVDSATMMNKGLEMIEACWLFDTSEQMIQVVVHPQSTIHSMVAYSDGSVLAQLGQSDMRTPIAYSLAWPERLEAGVEALDFFDLTELNFQRPDFNRFPCLRLAYEAHQCGGYASIALNAANEIAVEAFLERRIAFTDIPHLIETVLADAPSGTPTVLSDILHQNDKSRQQACLWIKQSG